MKKFLQVLFNIFWILTGGLFSAISNGLFGCLLCATIIGIPFGLQYFKFVKLSFAPVGKGVATKFSKHPIMNILWLIFGGLEAVIIYCAFGVLLCISVIGIPFGVQMFKLARLLFAPFGAQIVKDGEYTLEKNTGYDYDLLADHIRANPNLILGEDTDGNPMSVLSYLKMRSANMKMSAFSSPYAVISVICVILGFICSIAFIVNMVISSNKSIWLQNLLFDKNNQITLYYLLFYAIYFGGGAMIFSLFILASSIFNHETYPTIYKDDMYFLMDYYPNGSPIKKTSDWNTRSKGMTALWQQIKSYNKSI